MSNLCYEVRIYATKKEDLEYIDFSKVEDGILILKSPYDRYSHEGKIGVSWSGISMDLFVNGNESVGMIISTRDLNKNNEDYDLYVSNFKPKDPLRGSIDILSLIIRSSSNSKFKINKGDKISLLRFVSKKYFDLLMNKNSDGVITCPIDIKVFINNEFKPHSKKQLDMNLYEIVKKDYPKNCKFYEMEYVSVLDNYFDKNGNEIPPKKECILPEDYHESWL